MAYIHMVCIIVCLCVCVCVCVCDCVCTLAAATMARAMPVLPEVGSTSVVFPCGCN